MAVKFSNNASSTLAGSISDSATSITLADANAFPSIGAGEWFPLTVVNGSGDMEIMRVTARSGDTLTVVRAQEDTAAVAFASGAKCDLRLTAAALADIAPAGGGEAGFYFTDWAGARAGDDNSWRSITYGDGVFIAVADGGDSETSQVMISSNGALWFAGRAAEYNSWRSVTFGGGRFVAVGNGEPITAQVMYSDDGVDWTAATAADDSSWTSVTFGDGRFVAVAENVNTGTAQVMYSDDGETWTAATAADDSYWTSVTFGEGRFVAVAFEVNTGTAQVMYSDDGVTWTAATAADDSYWSSVTYGDGRFVAVANAVNTGTSQVMYSDDGATWTAATAADDSYWSSVTYGDGRFVAVASGVYTGNWQVMYSDDGVDWTAANEESGNAWKSVTYGDGRFVAVSEAAFDQFAVMYSFTEVPQAVRPLPQRVSALLDAVDRLDLQLEGLDTQVTDIGLEVSGLNINLETLTTDVATLGTSLSGVTTDVASLTTNVGALGTDVSNLSSDVSLFSTDVTNLGTDVAAVQTEVETLSTDAEDLSNTVAGIADRLVVASRFSGAIAGGVIVGNFYDNSFHGGSPTTLAGAANRVEMAPFMTAVPLTIDQIGVAISTQIASSLLKCFIYSSNDNGWPDALLYEGATNLDGSSLGYKAHTLSPTFTFDPGRLYWIGVRSSSTATYRAIPISSALNLGLSGSNGTTYFTVIRRTLTFSTALPMTWGFTGSDLVANITPPSIRMRAA